MFIIIIVDSDNFSQKFFSTAIQRSKCQIDEILLRVVVNRR